MAESLQEEEGDNQHSLIRFEFHFDMTQRHYSMFKNNSKEVTRISRLPMRNWMKRLKQFLLSWTQVRLKSSRCLQIKRSRQMSLGVSEIAS